MATRKLDNRGDGPVEFSALATAAITANPTAGKYPGGLFVKFDTDPNYFVITGAGDKPIGIVNSNVAINQPATIKGGVGKLRLITLGGTVALDADGTALVKADAAGKAVAIGTGAANVAGTVTKAGSAGDVVPILFRVGPPLGPA
jgi:hypothetical protein